MIFYYYTDFEVINNMSYTLDENYLLLLSILFHIKIYFLKVRIRTIDWRNNSRENNDR